MLTRMVPAATALIMLFGAAGDSFAGKPVACYEQYRTAPVYDTVYESVLVRPASQYVQTEPAIYGTRRRAVLLADGRVGYQTVPAIYETRYRTVKVANGGYPWEWRVIDGRRVLCKVKHKARYQKVVENVLVQAAYTRRVVIPAQYTYELERVVIQAERSRVIEVPATYETRARRVLISEGETGWRRVKIRQHCG